MSVLTRRDREGFRSVFCARHGTKHVIVGSSRDGGFSWGCPDCVGGIRADVQAARARWRKRRKTTRNPPAVCVEMAP